MSAFPIFDLIKATRLTRQGRLTEAMAALKARSNNSAPFKNAGYLASLSSKRTSNPRPEISTPAALVTKSKHTFGLHELRMPPKNGAAPMIPAGAKFEEAVFTNSAGSRAYWLYVPSRYNGQPLPLVVMLHGCTQSPLDFAAGTNMNVVAEDELFLVAYPAQPQSANPSKCWNWFEEKNQQRDQGEPALIAGITRQIMVDFSVDCTRVYVAGLSAGGAVAAIMGARYPDLYAAIGVHSGLACGAAKDLPSAFSAMNTGGPMPTGRKQAHFVPTIVFHGDQDRTVSPINGDQVIAQSGASGQLKVITRRGESSDGVSYERVTHAGDDGIPLLEQWRLHGVAHAWSGGSTAGSYTDPRGPNASREMTRFFLQHQRTSAEPLNA